MDFLVDFSSGPDSEYLMVSAANDSLPTEKRPIVVRVS